jgi:hypothetical protein
MLAHILKFLVAVVLLPFIAAEVWTLIDLAWMSAPAGEWRSTWFLSFCAGFATWLVIFFLLPRTMWLYVLGHEFTHALAAMLAGGKVSAFHVTSKGGHVLTDRVNWWIALSPYFVPIYALIWMALWVTVDFYHPLKPWQPILYFGIGVFWAFHVTFTVSMMHRNQTDLSGQGYLFSGVIILLTNLILVLFLLSFLTRNGVVGAVRLLGSRSVQTYAWTGGGLSRGAHWVQASWREHRS